MKIPLYRPYINSNIFGAVARVMESRKLSRGKEVEDFESEFARYVGKKYAIAVNSGTSGLHLVVRALGWTITDEVITTPFSYIASANALLFENVTPVFVDIDLRTLNIDPGKIEKKISRKTRGLLLVHVFGLPVNYPLINRIREKYDLRIIEDACEAIGKPDDNFIVTKLGDATVYSFHENKQLTTAGEGGMIVTDDQNIAKKCWSMRDQGRSLEKDWLNNVILGFNFRMTEAQAAFGRAQLEIIDEMLNKRARIADRYFESLKDMAALMLPDPQATAKRSWFLYFVIFKSPVIRNIVYDLLNRSGIGSSITYFPPIYQFPMYKDYKANCENTEYVSARLLALPMFYEMTNEQIDQVVSVIKRALKMDL